MTEHAFIATLVGLVAGAYVGAIVFIALSTEL